MAKRKNMNVPSAEEVARTIIGFIANPGNARLEVVPTPTNLTRIASTVRRRLQRRLAPDQSCAQADIEQEYAEYWYHNARFFRQ